VTAISRVTPQAISAWSRRLGHTTFYATYHGVGDPRRLLPPDLDLVFIACYTQASPLAYALALLYRRAGARTVIGGCHAKAFPADCLRYFDLVVGDCDEQLVADILARQFDPGSMISSAAPFSDVPTVQERLPEIRAASHFRGRWPAPISIVPTVASLGCPYRCNFCMDWDSPYRMLPMDRVAEDLRFVSRHLPGAIVAFFDPNFGLKFDQVIDVLEELPPATRPPYMIESSLTVLRGERIARLHRTNCVLVAPGIESWTAYSNKAGVGRSTGTEKVDLIAEHVRELAASVPYVQTNFIFGLDGDSGEEPIRLTKRFMDRTPFAWPAINIPVPFGGTPLFEELLITGRILETMPFAFWYAPYLVMRPKNYDPATYYERLLELVEHAAAPEMLRRRIASSGRRRISIIHRARTAGIRADARAHHRLLGLLRENRQFAAFHDGRSTTLPEYYHWRFEQLVKPYAELFPRRDRTPTLR